MKKDVVFFVHGMFANSLCWRNFVNMFKKQGFHCIAPTLPFHEPGGFPLVLGKMGLEDYLQFLIGEVEKLERPPVVIGYSMGGLLAAKLAERGLAEAVILLAPATPAGVPKFVSKVSRGMLVVLAQSLIRGILTSESFLPRPRNLEYFFQFISRQKLRRMIKEGFFVSESVKVVRQLAFRREQTRVGKLLVPSLVIGDRDDRVIQNSSETAIFLGSEFREVSGNGHYPLDSLEVMTICINWLEKIMKK